MEVGSRITALTVVLFASFAAMSIGRGTFPVAVIQMSEEFAWDKTTIVSNQQI